jgi:hypothetical protein
MRLKRSTFFILIAGVLLLSLFVAGCTESSPEEATTGIVNPTVEPTEETPAPTVEETSVSTPEPTVEPTAQVQAYDLELDILKKEKRESAGGILPYPEKIFLIVVFRITNNGNIPYEYQPGLVRVEDDSGYRWGFVESATFQGGVLENPFRPMTIEPGDHAGGGLIFSVPKFTDTYRLLLGDDEKNIVAEKEIGRVSG